MPVVTLQKTNSVTRDTYLYQGGPTSTNGSAVKLYAGTSAAANQVYRALLKFDLGLIPNDAIINSANLILYQETIPNPNPSFSVYASTTAWDDNTSWNTKPDFSTTYKTDVPSPTAVSLSVDVKSIVQAWVNGTIPNHGFQIGATNEAAIQDATRALSSFDSATPSQRPTLQIDYTIPSSNKKQVEYVGVGTTASTGASTSVTPTIPAMAQTGDLMVAHLSFTGNNVAPITTPSGWTIQSSVASSVTTHVLATKTHSGSESNPTFTTAVSSNAISAKIAVFRNVKSVQNKAGTAIENKTAFSPSTPPAATVDRTLFANFNSANNASFSFNPPLSYVEGYDVATGHSAELIYRYMYNDRDQTSAEMQATASAFATGASQMLILEPYTNNPPTLTLTSPADNQTLAEGSTMAVQGNASDSDSGNVVTVKYKINSGTTRALTSGVSDGSSPLSFANTLTYSNKRVWDGATDVSGADLAENTDHTLTVWSEDDQGGKSAEVTRKFRVVWNRPPTISDSNRDLGIIEEAPSINYTVTDPESNAFTITEKINGTVIRTFAGVAGQQETITIPHDLWIRLDLDTPHALTVEATDSKGLTSIRTFTFTRAETHIEFMLNFDNPGVQGHFILDGMPERVLVTLERYIPEGAEIESVKVCNNALDAEPTWEDATIAVKGNRGFLFNNTNKTAANWAINIWVIIAKGTATERARLNGYGGAFD